MSSQQGGLLELVARGKKDVFFTSNPSVSFFHSVYRRAAPFSEEVYVSQPRNAAEWGRWVEFDYEHRGDLVRKVYIRLTLPTWLPDSVAARNSTAVITDLSGVAYGYCNNIGYQMLEKIQVFQDQIMIQELYGEYLDWRLRQMNTIASTLVIAASVGTRTETDVAIGRSATPGQLRIPIPLLGWEAIGEPGFPMVAMKQQRFRIRILLRKMEDVIVASDGRAAPKPWSKVLQARFSKTGPIETFTSLPETAMSRGIGIALETTQVYVPRDIQEWLRIQTWTIPFRTAQIQEFTIDDNQWNAAATASVTNFTLPFRLDFIGPVSRLLTAFQSEGSRRAGQRTALLTDAARQLRLNIANIDRVQGFPVAVFREVTSYWKNVRNALELSDTDKQQEVYTLTFGGRDSAQPAGTLNFSRSVQPQMFATLNAIPIDSRTQTRKSFFIVYAESWRLWTIKDEKGKIVVDE